MEMNKRRIPFLGEAKHATREALGMKPVRMARGGTVHGYHKFTAGAATGQGRLEKTKAYGIKGPMK